MEKFKELSAQLIEAKKEVERLTDAVKEERPAYIENNKPCDKGDLVEITLASGRKERGVVKSFGILKDLKVCVTSYSNKGMKYITDPHKEVVVIEKATNTETK